MLENENQNKKYYNNTKLINRYLKTNSNLDNSYNLVNQEILPNNFNYIDNLISSVNLGVQLPESNPNCISYSNGLISGENTKNTLKSNNLPESSNIVNKNNNMLNKYLCVSNQNIEKFDYTDGLDFTDRLDFTDGSDNNFLKKKIDSSNLVNQLTDTINY